MSDQGARARLRRSLDSAVVLFILSATLICNLQAQTNQGALAGVIYDPTGASVDGATVSAKNLTTGTTSTATTTSGGTYRFPALLVGRYDLTVTAPGFQTTTQQGVDVQVSSTTSANVTLTLGNVSDTVTVSAGGTTIQAESSDIGTVIDSKQEIELPLALGGVGAFRSPEAFIFLAPGVTGPGTVKQQ